jgi:hypothetical protein
MKQHDQFKFSHSEVAELTPATAPKQVTLETNGAESDLLRDTLAFHIAQAGNLLLQQTFSNAGTVSRYFGWLDDLDEDTDDESDEAELELARAGLGPDGSLKLVARPRVDEFLGYLNHPEFAAVVSLAYSVAEREIIGIHLVGFNGKPMLATRWLQGLQRALTRQAVGANIPAYIN